MPPSTKFCDLCRAKIQRRISLREKLGQQDPALDSWLKENMQVCRSCWDRLEASTLPRVSQSRPPTSSAFDVRSLLPSVPTTTSLDLDLPSVPTRAIPEDSYRDTCRACGHAMARKRSAMGGLSSNMANACEEIKSCERCLTRVQPQADIAREIRIVLGLLKKWAQGC